MKQSLSLTDKQREASRPWAIAGAAVLVISLISYSVAIICYGTGTITNAKIFGLWLFGTAAAMRVGSVICSRQMQKIAGEPQTKWLSMSLFVPLALIGMMIVLVVAS